MDEALRKQWLMAQQDQRISEAITREHTRLHGFHVQTLFSIPTLRIPRGWSSRHRKVRGYRSSLPPASAQACFSKTHPLLSARQLPSGVLSARQVSSGFIGGIPKARFADSHLTRWWPPAMMLQWRIGISRSWDSSAAPQVSRIAMSASWPSGRGPSLSLMPAKPTSNSNPISTSTSASPRMVPSMTH